MYNFHIFSIIIKQNFAPPLKCSEYIIHFNCWTDSQMRNKVYPFTVEVRPSGRSGVSRFRKWWTIISNNNKRNTLTDHLARDEKKCFIEKVWNRLNKWGKISIPLTKPLGTIQISIVWWKKCVILRSPLAIIPYCCHRKKLVVSIYKLHF